MSTIGDFFFQVRQPVHNIKLSLNYNSGVTSFNLGVKLIIFSIDF